MHEDIFKEEEMMTRRSRLEVAVGLALVAPIGTQGQVRDGGVFGANLLCNPSFEDYYTPTGVEFQDKETMQRPLQTDQTTHQNY